MDFASKGVFEPP